MYYHNLILIVFFNYAHSLNMGVTFTLSNIGMQFVAVNPVQYLRNITSSSLKSCALQCIMMLPYCHTFEFHQSTQECRLIEGDLTTGNITLSTTSPDSIVGTINLTPESFKSYGQACSFCIDNIFLKCINNTCQCASNSYFDGSVCQLQQFTGVECNSNDMCRSDLNLTCLQFFKCGPPSVLLGVTVAGYGNGSVGSDAFGLYSPFSVYVMSNGDLYVADMNNQRVQHYINGSRLGQTVAGNGTIGSDSNQLDQPLGIYVDASTYDVYVSDSLNDRIQLWRVNATQGQTIIDTSFSPSPTFISGSRRDAQGNFYVTDLLNARIIRWPPNGTVGLIIAGTGTSGSDNQSFNFPIQIDLDANSEYMYIADMYNHRVQKWKVPYNGSAAATSGVTVAGGNGQGSGANQLNTPQSVCVSKKTGAIYIADTYNYRVQLWAVGATQGVTIAGNPGGPDITGPAQFNVPAGVILDPDENYLYVADQANHRVQRFTLI